MGKHITHEQLFVRGGEEMNGNKYSFKDTVKLYYGEPKLSEEEEKAVDEMLKEMGETRFLEKCKKVAEEKEYERKKRMLHIGRLYINKAAGILLFICIISILGGVAYAAVITHIKEVKLVEKEDRTELVVEYNEGSGGMLKEIEDYYTPAWIPEGYYIESEFKTDDLYNITYGTKDSQIKIYYSQSLPKVKHYFGVENGKHEKVSFDKFSGEFIVEGRDVYLIVTDRTYLYSILTDDFDKETLKKMLTN